MPRAAPLVLLLLAGAASADESPPCAPGAAFLVDGIGTPEDDLVRVAEDAGAVRPELRMVRRAGLRLRSLCAEGPEIPWAAHLAPGPAGDRWWTPIPARLDLVLNTNHPSGGNDGLLWAGRGISTMLSAGAAARLGVLSAQVAPAVAWQQNAWFETVPTGQTGDLAFANPFYGTNADLPQRFGAGPYATWSPGETFLRVDAFGAAAGVSTERFWLGPGQRNSLLMSGTAPGFPHFFLGTSRPADLWILDLEVQAVWGRLSRSRYFEGGDHPWLSLLTMTLEPHFAPGLQIGFARVVLSPWSRLESEGFLPFLGIVVGAGANSPVDNQIGVVWWRWAFPEVGFEMYGEWGKEDRESSLAAFTRELKRTQAYVLGLQKVFRWDSRWVRVYVEVSHLQDVRPTTALDSGTVWYTHPADLSYTNEGQLLGAFVGPGGSSQTLSVDVFGTLGRIGGFVERVERNEKYYWTSVEPTGETRDVEISGGLRGVAFLGPVEVSGEASYGYRWDRDFLGRAEPNVRVAAEIAYRVR